MRAMVAVTAGAALLAAACGGGGASSGGSRATTSTTGPALVRYQATATVLDQPGRGPQLCLGGVAESLPPQCGGPAVANWDWAAVTAEGTAAGVTWGRYRVVGTYEGGVFTLTEPARPAPPPARSLTGLGTPCNEPHNGFLAPEPGRDTPQHLERAMQLARTFPGLAGVWVDDPSQPRPDGTVRKGHLVLNVAVTGDTAAREAELRGAWGGALCVSRAARTLAQLAAIRQEVLSSPPAGLQVLGAAVSEPRNVVDVQAVVVTPAHQAALDQRFGEGTVRAEGALRPL